MAFNRNSEFSSEEEFQDMMENPPHIQTQESNTSMMPPPAPSNQGAGTSGTGKKKSPVWQHFTKVPAPEDGPNKWKITCKLCIGEGKTSPIYSWTTGQGTGTVARHLKDKHGLQYNRNGDLISESTGQTQIGNYAQPGGGTPFIFNRDRMIDGFADYIAFDELPFTTAESIGFERFAQLNLNPQFKKVSRNTIQRHMRKTFKAQRASIIEYFKNFDGRVGLTADCWTSSQGEPYLCVTVHWLNQDFLLEKRIIAFDAMEESHSGFNIYNRIIGTLKDFNLFDKIFSISFDNASANTKCVDYFIKGDIPLLLNGDLVHVRCCAHILNLSAQNGIYFIKPLLDPIRKVIKWIRHSHRKKADFKILATQFKLNPEKQFTIDTPTRWNSTYKMLLEAIQYKNVITILYNDNHVDAPNEIITDEHWNIAISVCSILEAYFDATNTFSLVYKPNVHLVILTCVQILSAVSNVLQSDPRLLPIWQDMHKKWCDYFLEFPLLYGVACLLDPGVRRDMLYNLLEHYYSLLGIDFDVNDYVEKCVDCLIELYKLYDTAQPDDSDTLDQGKSRFKGVLGSIMYKKPKTSSSSSSSSKTTTSGKGGESFAGVYEYLEKKIKDATHEGFDIFAWWKKHQDDFPVLTKIAKDVLVVPASTVASESAFSAGRRIINERRTSLTPSNVSMCVLKRDWDRATTRTQDQTIEEDIDEEDDPFTIMSGSSTDGNDS